MDRIACEAKPLVPFKTLIHLAGNSACALALLLLVGSLNPLPASAQQVKVDSDTISGLGARNIGSAQMSGRVDSIAAVKEKGRLTVFIGSASGGLWKSMNGGTTYKPVFDKQTSM